jgi:hypothetical protein
MSWMGKEPGQNRDPSFGFAAVIGGTPSHLEQKGKGRDHFLFKITLSRLQTAFP